MHPIRKQTITVFLSFIMAAIAIACCSSCESRSGQLVKQKEQRKKDSIAFLDSTTVWARIREVPNVNLDDSGYCSAQYVPIIIIQRINKYYKAGDLIITDSTDDVLYFVDSVVSSPHF